MLEENWLNVRRLLVVGDSSSDRVLRLLAQALPNAEITWISFAGLPQHLESQEFEAAIVLSAPGESPYPAAYRCYLAGILLRAGQSAEFGGGVLSHWIRPLEGADSITHHLHLLHELGFSIELEELNDGTTAHSHLAHSR